MTAYRPELPPAPPRIAALPLDHRGYPVPWFVSWLNGKPEFRMADERKLRKAITEGLCWICGQRMSRWSAYVVGPMCAVNRTSAEPPSHPGCGMYAAEACPFLARPHARRREAGLPEEAAAAPGITIARNPGVALVWITDKPLDLFRDPRGGVLFHLPEPQRVRWYAEGREANRAEVDASIASGLPLLEEQCEGDEDRQELARLVQAAESLLPVAVAA